MVTYDTETQTTYSTMLCEVQMAVKVNCKKEEVVCRATDNV
jgi:hypothetical protein